MDWMLHACASATQVTLILRTLRDAGRTHPKVAFSLNRYDISFPRLPEQQRIVLLLVAVEGVSYREAASILNIPIGTVTSRIARARATLVSGLDERPTSVLCKPPTDRLISETS